MSDNLKIVKEEEILLCNKEGYDCGPVYCVRVDGHSGSCVFGISHAVFEKASKVRKGLEELKQLKRETEVEIAEIEHTLQMYVHKFSIVDKFKGK